MVQACLQRTLEVWEGDGTAPEAHLLAHVVSPTLAILACIAWHTDLEGDPVADFEGRDVLSDGDNFTS